MKRYITIITGAYLFFAVGVDHFLLRMPLKHTLTDPLNLIFPILIGLCVGWLFRPKK